MKPLVLRGRTSSRRRVAIATLVSITLGAAACGGDDSSSSSDPAPSSTGAAAETTTGDTGAAAPSDRCTDSSPRGDLTMGTAIEATSLDPAVSRGTGVSGGTELLAIYDTLLRWNPRTEEYEPRIATSAEPNEDASVWTVKLRSDVKFGNGDPLTAETVKASIERFHDPASTSRWVPLASIIESIDTPDPTTVVFNLAEPWGTFQYLLAHELGMIVNPAVLEALGPDAFGKLPVGAGPFEPASFQPGEGIHLIGKADYWGGPVCIDKLTFVTIAGAPGSYDALRAGELDLAWMRDPKVFAQAAADGYTVDTVLQNGGSVLMLNAAEGHPTADVDVRRAIALAIDPQVLDDRITGGNGLPTDALIGEGSRLHTIDGPGYDVEAAKELVEAAKAKGFDGTVHIVGTSDPQGSETVLTVQAMLEAAGFTVNADYQQIYPVALEKTVTGNFDITVWGLTNDDNAPWPRLDSHLGVGAPGNYWGLDDAQLTAALDATRTARSTEELRDAVAQLQTRWNEIAPGVVYASVREGVVLADHVHGVEFTQESSVLLAGAWVDG